MLLAVAALAACNGSSTQDKHKEVVARFIQEFRNDAKHGIADELMTADFTHDLPDPRLPEGREVMKHLGQSIATGSQTCT